MPPRNLEDASLAQAPFKLRTAPFLPFSPGRLEGYPEIARGLQMDVTTQIGALKDIDRDGEPPERDPPAQSHRGSIHSIPAVCTTAKARAVDVLIFIAAGIGFLLLPIARVVLQAHYLARQRLTRRSEAP